MYIMLLIRQKRIPFPFNNHFCQNSLDLIDCDVWGPYSISTHDAYKYFLTIVNDHTRSTWVYLMKSKSNTRPLKQTFYQMI